MEPCVAGPCVKSGVMLTTTEETEGTDPSTVGPASLRGGAARRFFSPPASRFGHEVIGAEIYIAINLSTFVQC